MEYTVYSEEEYYNKIELLSIYNATIANCIWEEILKYRELFKHELAFQNRIVYLTMNQTLYEKILRVYEIELNETIHNFKIETCIDTNQDMKQSILKYIGMYKVEIDKLMFSFLLGDALFIIKVFVIYKYIGDLDFLYLFLYLNNKQKWYIIISKMELEIQHNKESKDITKEFRDFLDKFYFISCENMIKLKSTIFVPMDIEGLVSQYPMCDKKQLNFYLNHCKKDHYYSIKQYIETNSVSYETARKAMEQLETLKFYNKIKIGKKFVFTPVG